jgi:hypothetical protein
MPNWRDDPWILYALRPDALAPVLEPPSVTLKVGLSAVPTTALLLEIEARAREGDDDALGYAHRDIVA